MDNTIIKKPGKTRKKGFEPIHSGPRDWSVFQLSRNKKTFIREVTELAIKRIKKQTPTKESLIEELETTLYREKLRIKRYPWKVDPPDEAVFWGGVKQKLLELSSTANGRDNKVEEEILQSIVSRYANEISGNFKASSYRVARAIATFGFRRLLNAARIKKFGAIFRRDLTLRDKINIVGHTEQIRKLAKKGTVIMLPTHFSNLDSVLIGWVIHELGLPPFIYGAGLNLFNIGIFAYFMNSLGAYKVDRRKKNLPYLETLKAYSSLAVKKGAHSLFFPGGTRSRSGQIEDSLKLGLLGTTIEAQREIYQDNPGPDARKIFIFPVVINYHFVLEAPLLINDYLRLRGQEKYYVENDNLSNSYNILKFMIKFFTKGSDISVSIGHGVDVLGNYVDDEGNSTDKRGKIIDSREYFVYEGRVTENKQREEEYTRMLAKAIVSEFHISNRVFSSHIIAFVAFEMIKNKYPQFDLFNLLRIPEDEIEIPYEEFRQNVKRLRKKIFKMKKKGIVGAAPHLEGDVDEVINHGLSNLGLYHTLRPLKKNKKGNIITMDLARLYYYHNRLKGYDLEKKIK
jgi:glycerol-3-phosphate O-acyltransferase